MNMAEMKVAAGIVVYNPDSIPRFVQSINSILKQTRKVYIFNNGSENIEIQLPHNVEYITENENKGIAYALNVIMQKAKADGYKWVVTMDQDSILPDGLIDAYCEAITEENNIAIVCPQVIDLRRAYMVPKQEPDKEYINECITSASCTSIEAWEKIGMFDEWLFIDLVDNEFCKRLIASGYKILRLNRFVLNQEFGKIVPKSPNKQRFWIRLSKWFHNENIAKFSYKKYVSPIRVYYTNRNIIYVNRKMKLYGATAYSNYNCKGYLGFLISFSFPSLLRAQQKGKVLKAIISGIYDGVKAPVTLWRAK